MVVRECVFQTSFCYAVGLPFTHCQCVRTIEISQLIHIIKDFAHEITASFAHVSFWVSQEGFHLEFRLAHRGLILVAIPNLRSAPLFIVHTEVVFRHLLEVGKFVLVNVAHCIEQCSAELRILLLCVFSVAQQVGEIHCDSFFRIQAFVVSCFFKVCLVVLHKLIHGFHVGKFVSLVEHMPKLMRDCRQITVHSCANGICVGVVHTFRTVLNLAGVDCDTENFFRGFVDVGNILRHGQLTVFPRTRTPVSLCLGVVRHIIRFWVPDGAHAIFRKFTENFFSLASGRDEIPLLVLDCLCENVRILLLEREQVSACYLQTIFAGNASPRNRPCCTIQAIKRDCLRLVHDSRVQFLPCVLLLDGAFACAETAQNCVNLLWRYHSTEILRTVRGSDTHCLDVSILRQLVPYRKERTCNHVQFAFVVFRDILDCFFPHGFPLCFRNFFRFRIHVLFAHGVGYSRVRALQSEPLYRNTK